jgi:hypothetical protein
VTHWRTFLDSDVIRFVDLQDQEFTLKISKVVKGKVTGKSGKANGKAMIYFEGREKPLGAGTAILSEIGRLYGNDVRKWPGKFITIWPDPSVVFGGEKVGGVRVRPVVPKVDAGPSVQKESA